MPFPYMAAGDRVTILLATGQPFVGKLLDVKLDKDGALAGVLLQPDRDDMPPLAINGRMVGLWHQGDPPASTRLLGGLAQGGPAGPFGRG